MERIDIQNFKKYYRNNDGNATLARIGHVNAVIDELENKIDAPENPNDGDIIVYQQSTDTWINVANTGGGGLEGTQYVFVAANGTDVENAAELQAAYDEAKTMSPSATNRITVIAAPGNYNFGFDTFVMDEPFIALVSLDGNRSIEFNSSSPEGTLWITSNNVYVKGVDVKTKALCVGDNLNNILIENCKGGDYSFGFGGNISGTFIDCEGGNASFASAPTLIPPIGVLYNGPDAFASGTFINCKAGASSFGMLIFGSTNASGIFTNCTALTQSFGSSFDMFTAASGTFLNCVGGDLSFAGSFVGNASGMFTDCVGGNSSFGGQTGGPTTAGTLTGKLYYCRLTSGTFQTVSGGGVTVLCIDGNNQINTQN